MQIESEPQWQTSSEVPFVGLITPKKTGEGQNTEHRKTPDTDKSVVLKELKDYLLTERLALPRTISLDLMSYHLSKTESKEKS